ncbi:TolC family outer membrane protein [Larsenimonas suaedae]|uniref:TolC family outer membrane protein n=1 Tax=Larsenimonas suaedae TaxID=1851019 RepID=A0ABU1GU89_9GAMM|nr:TolC family outer membrane protein [Larsenimonas suaedae]MCM2972051.1 TolC family outer membrane protein [Larsenimonas suaedae]MDR5895604.1 TolC family outer membrane protein [Larsenimonas suaedae]
MKQRWCWWMALCLAPSAVQAQTLAEAVSKAVHEHPITRAEIARFEARAADTRAAKGAYLPSVNVSARTGRGSFESEVNGIAANSEPHDYRRASVTLTQLIWDGNATVARIRQAGAEQEYQKLQAAAAANSVALSSIEAYLNVLRSEQLVALAENNVRLHEDTASDIRRRAEQGAGTTADSTQVDGRLAQARASLMAARNNLADARSAFQRYIGEAPRGLSMPEAPSLEGLPSSLEQVEALAYSQNPLLLSAKASIRSQQHQRQVEKGDFWPTFSFEANRSWAEDYDYEGVSDNDWSTDLVMNYNLYRGGIDSAELRAQTRELEVVQYETDRARREVNDELRLAWNARDFLKSQMPYLEQHLESSKASRVNYRKQFDIGRRTLLDLLDSETEYYQAQQAELQAQFDLMRARYRLLSATGQLLDTLKVDVRWPKNT